MSRHSAGGARSAQDGPTIDLTNDESTPSDFVDYYEILGVARSVSGDELKKAYRKQALRWHPDKNPASKEHAEVQFKLVAEAYEVLANPDKRQIYDKYGREGLAKNRGPARDEASDDPFSFFRRAQSRPFGGHNHFSFFIDPFEMFRQFFGSSDPFGFEEEEDDFGFGGMNRHFMGPNLFQQHFSLFNRPSLFAPFGSPFQALQDFSSHPNQPGSTFITSVSGGRGGSNNMIGRSVSTSIQIINGKATKTTRVVENGVETVTVEENGVETSRRVNGVPVTSPRPMEAIGSVGAQQASGIHSRTSTRQVPASRAIPTSFSTSGGHGHNHLHQHHHQVQQHHHQPQPQQQAQRVHRLHPHSTHQHQHQQTRQHPSSTSSSASSSFSQQHHQPVRQTQAPPAHQAPLSHISHFTINP